jgi:hypothetical protein
MWKPLPPMNFPIVTCWALAAVRPKLEIKTTAAMRRFRRSIRMGISFVVRVV